MLITTAVRGGWNCCPRSNLLLNCKINYETKLVETLAPSQFAIITTIYEWQHSHCKVKINFLFFVCFGQMMHFTVKNVQLILNCRYLRFYNGRSYCFYLIFILLHGKLYFLQMYTFYNSTLITILFCWPVHLFIHSCTSYFLQLFFYKCVKWG